MEPKSFTSVYPDIVDRLITDCGICRAYVPNPNIPHPKVETFRALWDTGASRSTISSNVVERLGLQPTGFTDVYHAQGKGCTNVYKVNILLPNQTGYMAMDVLEGDLHNFDVLIGMDIISQGDFSITHEGNRTIFSFQTPSTHNIDFVEEQARQKALQQASEEFKKKL